MTRSPILGENLVAAGPLLQRIAELEAEVERLHHVADVTCQHLAARSEDNARLGVEVERLRAALDAWLDWDRTAESDTSGTILERARVMTDAAITPPAKEKP